VYAQSRQIGKANHIKVFGNKENMIKKTSAY